MGGDNSKKRGNNGGKMGVITAKMGMITVCIMHLTTFWGGNIAVRPGAPVTQVYAAELSCCCDSRSYCLRRTVYWQTIKPVSVTS